MKNGLFDPENWLWKPFAKVTDFLILSALWLFTCIPVVTAGSALTALYDCSAHCVRDGEKQMVSRYFRTLRREFLSGLPSFLLWALIIGAMYSLMRKFTATAAPTSFNLVLAYGSVFLMLFVIGIASWVFPLLSRFTFAFQELNLTAFRLALIYLPRTFALAVCNTLALWVCLKLWIPLMIVPGIAGLISSNILEPVFKKYEKEQQEQEITECNL